MLTYEQLIPILVTQAQYFAKRSGFRYEINELINEVWVRGNVQKLEHIEFAWNKTKQEIINYIRRQEGRENSYKYRFSSNLQSITDYENLIKDSKSSESSEFEIKDLKFNIYRKFCRNETEYKVLHLRIFGYKLMEIAKMMGFSSKGNISMILNRIAKRIKKDRDFVCEHFGKVA